MERIEMDMEVCMSRDWFISSCVPVAAVVVAAARVEIM
jgi:hypothetical protein